ncbi:MAG: hypothetical protein LGR52_05720 [Candidatus Thiosymbion ectosymbiont of Robbea hypermnestra]|nr:hypothetical protein [Candidatus Thiosymbion ectosymbiont of Robbea hypermnestra]
MAKANSTRPATTLEITFTHETLAHVREALLIGLAAYGEIERLSNAQEARARIGKKTKKDLRVIHPTGTADTVSRFADALRFLD